MNITQTKPTKVLGARIDKDVHDEYIYLNDLLKRNNLKLPARQVFTEAVKNINKETREYLESFGLI